MLLLSYRVSDVLCSPQNLLYQSLLIFRNGLAREGQIAPFLVCSNGLLAHLARARYMGLFKSRSYIEVTLDHAGPAVTYSIKSLSNRFGSKITKRIALIFCGSNFPRIAIFWK